MKIALFARYSSKMQDELSIEAQLSEMEAFVAKQPGWRVTHRYLLPETRSVDVERSPQFQAMRESAKRRDFQLLLVHKLDRFGRDREAAVVHKAWLRRKGIQVLSVVENLADNIQGRAMEGMLEVMAEFYSANLAEETRKGHKQVVRKGGWTGGKVPWGLRVHQVDQGGRLYATLAADETWGPVMAEVFERVARGDRTGEVLEWVEARTGDRWSKPTFYTRIRNPVYFGRIEYGRTSMRAGHKRQKLAPEDMTVGEWEGLVSREVWEAANRAIRGRAATSHNGLRPAKRVYLLSGIALCKQCGRGLIGSRHHGEGRYVCPGRRDRTCTTYSIPAERLEERMLEVVRFELEHLDVPYLMERYRAGEEPEREAARRREARLRRDLTRSREAQRNLLRLVEEGGPLAGVAERLRQLDVQQQDLAQEMATCQARVDQVLQVNAVVVEDYLRRVGSLLVDATPETLRTIYEDLFRLEFDLEKKKGQLLMKLAQGGEGGPHEFDCDTCVSRDGRSARTIPYTQRLNWLVVADLAA